MSLTAEELGSENRKASARLPQTKSICQAPAHPNSGTVDSHFRCVLGKLAHCFLNPKQIRNSKLVHFDAYGKMTAVSLTGREGGKIKRMKCRHKVYNMADQGRGQIMPRCLKDVMMVQPVFSRSNSGAHVSWAGV